MALSTIALILLLNAECKCMQYVAKITDCRSCNTELAKRCTQILNQLKMRSPQSLSFYMHFRGIVCTYCLNVLPRFAVHDFIPDSSIFHGIIRMLEFFNRFNKEKAKT